MNMTNPNGEDKMLEQIKSINDLSDANFVADIKYRLGFYNTAGGANKEIWEAAKEKGLI